MEDEFNLITLCPDDTLMEDFNIDELKLIRNVRLIPRVNEYNSINIVWVAPSYIRGEFAHKSIKQNEMLSKGMFLQLSFS